VDEAQHAITTYVRSLLSAEEKRLTDISRHFGDNTKRMVERNGFRLQSLVQSLKVKSEGFIKIQKSGLHETANGLRFKPIHKISNEKSRVVNLVKMLSVHAQQSMKNETGKVATFETKVRLLEPRNVLKRGYSITFHNGKAVRDITALKTSDLITTELHHGTVKSRIESTESHGE
jgi:exodeoxyribonuclease VII large subunit